MTHKTTNFQHMQAMLSLDHSRHAEEHNLWDALD